MRKMPEDHVHGDGTPLVEINIQDVIRDRKAERKLKAEEKRQADLQRIRDMRSTTGIDPLQRFPKEIWMKIFEELSPDDQGNIRQIHPLFRDLLEKTRIRDILFPQILNLIQTKYKRFIMPDLERKYWFEDFRLISKSTRKSFDRRMDLIAIKQIQEGRSNSSPCFDGEIVDHRFDATKERELATRLLTTFQENPGKLKFFPRGLNVNLTEYDDIEVEDGDNISELMNQFRNDITALLKKIGDQIWHFRFFLDRLETLELSFVEVYTLLQGWISSMPNLRYLEVLILPPFQMVDEEDGKEEMKEAQSALQNHPFPHLPHLERLSLHSSFHRGSGRFQNIYGAILGANQHIKMLDLNEGDDHDNPDLPHLPPDLSKSLELTRFSVGDEYWSYGHAKVCLAGIRPVINLNWKLKTLILSLTSGEPRDSINSVLQLLQHFPTLEKVRLERMKNFIVRDTDKIGYLELPNLKEFELEFKNPDIDYNSNIHFFFSLQFLVHSKYLKKLSWALIDFDDGKLRGHLKKMEDRNHGKVIDFRGGLKYLYDAEMWHIFPCLDEITVRFRKLGSERWGYCRHEYLRKDIEDMSIMKFFQIHSCIPDFRSHCVM